MSFWKTTPNIESINKMQSKTLLESLEIVFTDFTENTLSAKMPVGDKTVQPFRILHGGASIALAETVGSVASLHMIDSETQITVGQSVSSNHLKAARSGDVLATAKAKHIGKSSQVWEIEIRNENNDLVNITILTMAVLDKKG